MVSISSTRAAGTRGVTAIAAAVAMAGIVASGPAVADWPERPIQVLVPFEAGGTTDILARLFQQAIAENEILPEPIAILNTPGRHFTAGAIQHKQASPDGYHFMILQTALLLAEASGVTTDVSYRDFELVAATGRACLHPYVRDDSPYHTLQELMDAARDQPDTLLFGVNIGAINHAAGAYLEGSYPGAKFRFVQIGGGPATYTAIRGEQIQVAVMSSSEYANFRDGGIRALGYTGPERHPDLPDIPTVREQGFDFDFCLESYWFAPKGTPQEAVEGFADALEAAMATDQMQEAFVRQYTDPLFVRGDALVEHMARTYEGLEPVGRQMMGQ